MIQVTQKQIKKYGATKYMTIRIIKGPIPSDKRGRQYFYSIEDVLRRIEEYASAPRIRKKTRTFLYELMKKVSQLNSVTLPNDKLYKLECELREALISTKQTFAENNRNDRKNVIAKRKSEKARFNYRRNKVKKEKIPSLLPVGEVISVDLTNKSKVNRYGKNT